MCTHLSVYYVITFDVGAKQPYCLTCSIKLTSLNLKESQPLVLYKHITQHGGSGGELEQYFKTFIYRSGIVIKCLQMEIQ